MKRNEKSPRYTALLLCLCVLLLGVGSVACAVTPVRTENTATTAATTATVPSVTPTTTPSDPTAPTSPTQPTSPTTLTVGPTASSGSVLPTTTHPGVQTPEAYLVYRSMLENMTPIGVMTSASLACLYPAVTLTSETSVTLTADGNAVFSYAYDTLAPVGSGSSSPIVRVSGTATLGAGDLSAAGLASVADAAVVGWLDFSHARISYEGPAAGEDGQHTVIMTVADGDADLLFGFETGYTGLVMTWVFDMAAQRPLSVALSADAPAGKISASATYLYA